MRRALPLGIIGVLAVFAAIGGARIVIIGFFVAVGLLLVLAVPVVIRSAMRSRSSRVCWLVSLAVSAVLVTPEMAFGHHRHFASAVIGGILWWLLLASLLRLVIFLADYFRRRTHPAATTG